MSETQEYPIDRLLKIVARSKYDGALRGLIKYGINRNTRCKIYPVLIEAGFNLSDKVRVDVAATIAYLYQKAETSGRNKFGKCMKLLVNRSSSSTETIFHCIMKTNTTSSMLELIKRSVTHMIDKNIAIDFKSLYYDLDELCHNILEWNCQVRENWAIQYWGNKNSLLTEEQLCMGGDE